MSLANGPIEGARPAEQAPAPEGRRLRALLLGMLSLVLLLGAVFGRHGLLEARQFRLERDRLRAEIVRLEAENAALEQEVRSLERDSRAVERIAREELSLVRPGEKLILLRPEQRHDQPITSTSPGLDDGGASP